MRRCAACGARIGSVSRPDRLYCNATCRKRAHRLRTQVSAPPDLAQLTAALGPHVSEVALVTGLAAAAQQIWQAAAFLLERHYPERWGRGARGEDDLDAELEEELWT